MCNKMHNTFTLKDITPPILCEMGYEVYPAGYIIFSSFWQYKKMKKLDRIIRYFLKRLPEIKKKMIKFLKVWI